VAWLLERGKKLERACEFANALKYYFAGRMYFARLGDKLEGKMKLVKEEFDRLHADLLPLTNSEVRRACVYDRHHRYFRIKRCIIRFFHGVVL
jgi:hypothetical protein